MKQMVTVTGTEEFTAESAEIAEKNRSIVANSQGIGMRLRESQSFCCRDLEKMGNA